MGEFWDVRLEAAKRFLKYQDPRSVDPLVIALSDKNDQVNRTAGRALVMLKEHVADGHIADIGRVLKNKEWQVRGNAARVLGRLGKDAALPFLETALKDEDLYVRSAAAEAIGELAGIQAPESLKDLLYDRSHYVRRMAAEALGKIGDFSAMESLESVARDDPDNRVRYAAGEAFKNLQRLKTLYKKVSQQLGEGLKSGPVKKSSFSRLPRA